MNTVLSQKKIFLIILFAIFNQSTHNMDTTGKPRTKNIFDFTNEGALKYFNNTMDLNHNNYKGSENTLLRVHNFSIYMKKSPLQQEIRDLLVKGYALELQRQLASTHKPSRAFAHEKFKPNLLFQAIATRDLKTMYKQLRYLPGECVDFIHLGFHPVEFALVLGHHAIAAMLIERTKYLHCSYRLSEYSASQLVGLSNNKSFSDRILNRSATLRSEPNWKELLKNRADEVPDNNETLNAYRFDQCLPPKNPLASQVRAYKFSDLPWKDKCD